KFIDNTSIFFNNVYFRYGSKTSNLILNNISFEIMPNKITAIVGSSGSGKTTLIKLLLKIYKPTDGLIVYGSDNIEDFNSDNWRKEFGAVMQDSFLFADTIVRNITESNSDNEIDKVQLLNSVKVANIEDFIENLPHGFNTRVGSSGMNISGGQRQRLFIARIIYKNSNFIIFDEATSSLDAKNEKIIIEKLQSFFKNKTVVIVAHRLSTVKNADQILVLEKGSIVEKGNHTELVNKKGLYFELIKNQLELGN
ncbi:MAG: ATP-binding cassette domain-containing protein, partial [Sediminibacterium sp.]|nr:ATP-binding cassette domain-containing protein [Sediminibacterium sp.]